MTVKPRHPRYSNKSDRIINPGATSAEIRCDLACAPLDRAAREADAIWGTDRLVTLVSPTTAEKYGRVMARLMENYGAGNSEAAAADAAIAVRGLAAMDAEARAAGHKPADPRVWIGEVDGHVFGIVEDVALVAIAERANPGAKIVTMRQVINSLLITQDAIVQAALAAFPGATVTAVRQRSELEESLNDEIMF